MRSSLRTLAGVMGCGLLALSLGVATARAEFPERPITIVVPFPPGGMADLTARPLASAMEKKLGHPVVILNKPGASGAVGIQTAAHAKPDGYTLMVTLVSYSIIPEVDTLFNRKPVYTTDQFRPLALVAADPPVLVVSASSPWKTIQELIADAKAHPNTITYSHSGLYGPAHVPMNMFLKAAGIQMRELPAVGGGPAMTLVLGNNASMWAAPVSMSVPHVQSGKLRVLASWGKTRHPAFPDAPTLKELGYDVEFYVWSGLFAPKGVPDKTIDIIRKAVDDGVKSPAFKTAMENLRIPESYRDEAGFRAFLKEDSAMLAKAVRAIGKVDAAPK